MPKGGIELDSGEALAKNVGAWTVFVLYAIHTIMAAISFHHSRRRRGLREVDGHEQQFTDVPKKASFVRVEERTYSGWDQHR